MTPIELKQLRKQAGLTQQELANKLHCISNTVARWEQGTHGITGLTAIAIRKVLTEE